jgi:hypothetical protein
MIFFFNLKESIQYISLATKICSNIIIKIPGMNDGIDLESDLELNPGDIYGDLAINICRVENQTHT